MQAVVQEINTEYQTQLDTTKANISYDVLEMSGSRAVWPEVLAIYAVKTTTDPDNAQGGRHDGRFQKGDFERYFLADE